MDKRPAASRIFGALLLAITLATNVVLVRSSARRWSSPGGELGTAENAAAAVAWPTGVEHAVRGISPDAWARLATAGPAELIERLRARGFPPAIVRAVVHAQVREQFALRYKAVADAAAMLPYWRGPAFSLSVDPRLERERRALDREVLEQVNRLLGPDAGEMSEAARRMFRRQYGDIHPDKIPEMMRIQADYADLVAQVHSDARGIMLPEDTERLAFLENALRSDFARLLSPQELEEVELHSSRTAAQLRRELSGFKPSEDEFRALFRLRQLVDLRFGGAAGYPTSENRRARADTERELAAEVERTLGAERYIEFRRATDPAWRSAAGLVAQLGLPASTTPQLMSVQEEISRRAAALRTNPSLSAAQQHAQLAALAHEARSRLSPLLGERGLAHYQQTAPWLRSLGASPAQ